jgi:hypothetical protein
LPGWQTKARLRFSAGPAICCVRPLSCFGATNELVFFFISWFSGSSQKWNGESGFSK